MSSGSTPRPPKGKQAPAPPSRPPPAPFDEKKQLAMAKALRSSKKKAAPADEKE